MDGVIAALAERQHGVVARWQLLARGIGTEAIRHRLDRGRLYRVHHGVYAVGHRLLTREGWWMAAVLAAGPGAVLSHCSAAALWRIRSDSRSYIEVTSPRRVHGRAGIKAHRATLPPDEMTLLAGIPVTTVPRTLLDLAAVLPPHQTRRAMTEAEFLRLGDAVSLDDLVHRHRGERGTKPLRDILENARIGQYVTRSELEVRFLTFLDERNLPRPQTNVIVEGREVDCFWAAHGLIAELDGHASHATRTTYEDDRLRDRKLTVAGLRTVRITWRQLHDDADGLEADLRSLIR